MNKKLPKDKKKNERRKESHFFSPSDPVLRIPDASVSEEFLVDRALRKFEAFENDRRIWMDRRAEYILQYDDIVTPVYKSLWDSSANLHLPLTESTKRAMHARIMQSIFFVNPPFFVDPQEDIDQMRLEKIESLMKYILIRYANFNKGIYLTIDDWVNDLCNEGMGILSRDWANIQRRSLRVVKDPSFISAKLQLDSKLADEMTMEEFNEWMAINYRDKKPYKEEMVVKTFFDGPILAAEDPAFILFKGDVVDSTDLDRHETVIKVCYFSRNELLSFKDKDYFYADVVDAILESKPDKGKGLAMNKGRHQAEVVKDNNSGIKTVNPMNETDEWEFLCVYDTINPDGAGGPQDRIVYFVHPATKSLARWTYMDRLTGNGKIPLHMAHLYRRPRKSIGYGIPQDLKPINDMLDILTNQSIDAGTLANNPMGLFRGNTSFDPDKFRVEPGVFYKADDPNNDVRLLSWPINPSWSMPIQSSLISFANQQSSLGALSSGQVAGTMGPLRSIGGLDRVLGQADINLDVIFKRINCCMGEVFEGMYLDCHEKMPEHLKIPVLGMDGSREVDDEGNPLFSEITTSELSKRVHFGLYGNSMLTNREAQLDASMKMGQFLLQPVGLQTGVVTPENVYNSFHDTISAMGKQRINRFITKPKGFTGAIPFESELACIAQNVQPPIVLADPEHQKKIERYQAEIDSEHNAQLIANGSVRADLMEAFQWALEKHRDMLQTINAGQTIANPTGAQMSPTMGLQQGQQPMPETNPEQGAVPQPEASMPPDMGAAPEGGM